MPDSTVPTLQGITSACEATVLDATLGGLDSFRRTLRTVVGVSDPRPSNVTSSDKDDRVVPWGTGRFSSKGGEGLVLAIEISAPCVPSSSKRKPRDPCPLSSQCL